MSITHYAGWSTKRTYKMYTVTEEDVKNADDQYCSKCKTKKEKYLGYINTTAAVLYRLKCDCDTSHTPSSNGMSPKKAWEHINTPYWKLMGLKPKPKDIAYERYLKSKNMTYGDAALARARHAQNPSAIGEFQKTRERGSNAQLKYEKR